MIMCFVRADWTFDACVVKVFAKRQRFFDRNHVVGDCSAQKSFGCFYLCDGMIA